MNELHLFAGCGGGILGGILCGHRPVCAVELEPYARRVLLQRQRDGILPWFPVWDDVTTFDGKPWNGIADVVCGGFPCTDISCANQKGEGTDGEYSGLWREMARIIGEVEPRFVFVENSPNLASRGLGHVLGDLATMGYNAAWGVLGGDDAGLLHYRKRMWIAAHSADQSIKKDFGREWAQRIRERATLWRKPVATGWGHPCPQFQEWLMDWVTGWSAIEPLETAKFRLWLLAHGKSSPAPMSEILTANDLAQATRPAPQNDENKTN